MDKDIYIRKRLYDIFCKTIKQLESEAAQSNNFTELDDYLEGFENKIEILKNNFFDVDSEISKIRVNEKDDKSVKKIKLNENVNDKNIAKINKSENNLNVNKKYNKIVISKNVNIKNYFNVVLLKKSLESLERNDI